MLNLIFSVIHAIHIRFPYSDSPLFIRRQAEEPGRLGDLAPCLNDYFCIKAGAARNSFAFGISTEKKKVIQGLN